MSLDAVRELVARLSTCSSALSALGLALRDRADRGAGAAPLPPAIAEPLEQVLASHGLRGALDDLDPLALRALLGEIRVNFLQGVHRVRAGDPTGAWTPTDAETLQAAGDVSAGFPRLVARFLPRLEGLAARLEAEDGRFLDVGVGVGVLAIEMARLWPRLQVVGIDVWKPALALARTNLATAGLADRIQLREQAVQDLGQEDDSSFDLAWLPSLFIPGAVIPQAAQRIHRVLRPGGWILFATLNPVADPLAGALARLRTAEWGGRAWAPAEVQALLAQAGFRDIETLPSPPISQVAFTAARR